MSNAMNARSMTADRPPAAPVTMNAAARAGFGLGFRIYGLAGLLIAIVLVVSGMAYLAMGAQTEALQNYARVSQAETDAVSVGWEFTRVRRRMGVFVTSDDPSEIKFMTDHMKPGFPG